MEIRKIELIFNIMSASRLLMLYVFDNYLDHADSIVNRLAIPLGDTDDAAQCSFDWVDDLKNL